MTSYSPDPPSLIWVIPLSLAIGAGFGLLLSRLNRRRRAAARRPTPSAISSTETKL
jgi:hypothetical protein